MTLQLIPSDAQLDIFPDRVRLRRSDPNQNMDRYYFMVVQRDLFGGASLVREWGRQGRAGQIRITLHTDEAKAVDALDEFARAKRKRGYVVS